MKSFTYVSKIFRIEWHRNLDGKLFANDSKGSLPQGNCTIFDI